MEEFKEFLLDNFNFAFGKKFKITTVTKNNGEPREGIVLEEGELKPVLYLNNYYEQYKENPASCLAQMIKTYQNAMDKPVFDLDNVSEFQQVIKERINFDLNKELLKTAVHKVELDTAIIYRQVLKNIPESETIATAIITKERMEKAGLTIEDLDRIAEKTQKEFFPLTIKSFSDVIPFLPDLPNMYIISTSNFLYGATFLTDPEVISKLKDLYDNNNFYILPSSVHELITVPYSEDSEGLIDMVSSINGDSSLVPKDIFLSNNIYYYNKDKDKVLIVE